MGFNIKNNYGPNIEVNEGGVVNLHMDKNGLWHAVDAEDAETLEEMPGEETSQPMIEKEAEEMDRSSVEKCFKFSNDFIRQQVEAVVNEFYQSTHANLALIEVVMYDHGLLRKRNQHTAFIKALAAWGIIRETDGNAMKQVISGIADKFKRLPDKGYKDWGKDSQNDKNFCVRIGQRLHPSMKYER